MDMRLSCLLKAQRKRRMLRYISLKHKIKEKSAVPILRGARKWKEQEN